MKTFSSKIEDLAIVSVNHTFTGPEYAGLYDEDQGEDWIAKEQLLCQNEGVSFHQCVSLSRD